MSVELPEKEVQVWRVEMTLAATAYIKATSAEEAVKIAKSKVGEGMEAMEESGDDAVFTGCQFDSPWLPDFSFSPAFTIIGLNEFRRIGRNVMASVYFVIPDFRSGGDEWQTFARGNNIAEVLEHVRKHVGDFPMTFKEVVLPEGASTVTGGPYWRVMEVPLAAWPDGGVVQWDEIPTTWWEATYA